MSVGGFDLEGPAFVLGGINGLAYGLLAVGLVLAYRSSGVINLALGQIGACGTVFLAVAVTRWDWWYWVAFPVALGVAALTGAAVNAGVVRRLRRSPPVIPLIAMLGVGQVLIFATVGLEGFIEGGGTRVQPPGFVGFEVAGFLVDPARSAALVLVPAAVTVLVLFLARHRIGRAIRAAAADPELARSCGVSPEVMSSISWGLAGAVAALVGILVSPTGEAAAQGLGLWLLLRALAAASLARMVNVSAALLAGVGIGVVEQLIFWNTLQAGLRELFLFGVIAIALALQPVRQGRTADKRQWLRVTPTVGSDRLRAIIASTWTRQASFVGFAAGTVLLLVVASPALASRIYFISAFAIVGISVAVVSGLGGQLSLGQFALAGIGAAASIWVTVTTGNFILGLAGAGLAAATTSVLLGLPGLHQSGQAFASLTLAFAVAAEAWLFQRPWFFEGGVAPGQPILGDLALDTPHRYATFALAILLVALLLARNYWRTRLARQLVAQRDNEDAARAFSFSPARTRVSGYAFAGLIAGLGGSAFVHGIGVASPSTFDVGSSLDAVALAALGGIATLWGPVIGATYVAGLPELLSPGTAFLATTALGWLLLVLVFPGGLAQALARAVDRVLPDRLAEAKTISLADAQRQPALFPIERTADREIRSDPLLQLRAVTVSFGELIALDDVDLAVAPGERVAVVGPNGAGKTTMFDVASGLIAPKRGRVLYDGLDVTAWPAERRAAQGLIRSFEDGTLFPTLSVLDVVQLAGARRHRVPTADLLLRGSFAERRDLGRTRELVHVMGLGPYSGRRVGALSTGMRRLTELTCVIALEPQVLLLDEPTSGLAQAEVEALVPVLEGVIRHLDLTVVMVEHDFAVAAAIGSRIVVMDSGSVAGTRTPDELRRSSGLSPTLGKPGDGKMDR